MMPNQPLMNNNENKQNKKDSQEQMPFTKEMLESASE
jgi:hypothetical protein